MNAADMPSAVDKRATAKDFFKRLEKYLNTQLPTIAAVNEDASRRKKEYLLTKDAKLLDFEPRFFKQQAVPCVHKFLTDEYGLTPKDAIQALLAEGWADLRKFASGTPASKPIYPYKKTLAATLKTARKDWWGTGKVLSNSEPDASGYDYACFLAYDASLGSTLSKAWQDINAQVSQSCWDALNIYVMIVRKEHQE